MSICLCYDSADKSLDLIALGCLSQLGRAGRPALDQCTARERDLKALQSLPIGFEEPVHVLVPRQELRICNERVCAHVWSGRLLNGSLVLLAPGVYTVSPQVNAHLKMKGATLAGRVLTVMGYCGIFAIDVSSPDGFVRRRQLATRDSFLSYAADMHGVRGAVALTEAATYAIERARSPLEARLAYALTASARLGGLGFDVPKLNALIEFGEDAQAIIGQRDTEVDLLWYGRNTIVEANGEYRHDGRFGDDLTRASALEAEGNSVRFVTSQQLRSPRQMLLLGAWLAERLGVEAPSPNRRKLKQFLAEIMAYRYPQYSLSLMPPGPATLSA